MFDETYSVGNFFLWPQLYDIFLYLVEMPTIPNFLHLQMCKISSGAYAFLKLVKGEESLCLAKKKRYLGTVYIAHIEVKDFHDFRDTFETGAPTICIYYLFDILSACSDCLLAK